MDTRASATGRAAVVGLGNILMGDDGVGVAVVEALRKESLPAHIELYDAGTALQDVLPSVAHCARVILVDCCRAGGSPGAIYRSTCPPDDWVAGPFGDSLHDLGVVQALRLHRIAGGNLGEVILIGVEPQDVVLREGLSPVLQTRLPVVLKAVRDELGTPSEDRRGGAL